jgi:hypothetical protein
VLEGKTVNSIQHTGTKNVIEQILRVRPQFLEKSSLFLLHNNASAYFGMSLKCSVVNHSAVISHPSNSPYLTPADFYLLLAKEEGFTM